MAQRFAARFANLLMEGDDREILVDLLEPAFAQEVVTVLKENGHRVRWETRPSWNTVTIFRGRPSEGPQLELAASKS